MAKKKRGKVAASKKEDPRVYAFIATFLTIIGFLIAILAKKDDKYVMFYAKQGLVLFLIQVIAAVVDGLDFIGGFIFGPALWILFVIVWVMAWVNALSGEMRNTWLVGDFAKKIKL
jgi:uncharacterized membrane protein